jgi:hypothetical protein
MKFAPAMPRSVHSRVVAMTDAIGSTTAPVTARNSPVAFVIAAHAGG